MERSRFLGVASAALLLAGGGWLREATAQTTVAGPVPVGVVGGGGVAGVGSGATHQAGSPQAPTSGVLGPGAPAVAPVAMEILQQIRSERWREPATALRDLAGRRLSLIRGDRRDANAIILQAVANSRERRPEFWSSVERGLGAEAARELESFRGRVVVETAVKQRFEQWSAIQRSASYEEARSRRALTRAAEYAKILLAGVAAPDAQSAVDVSGMSPEPSVKGVAVLAPASVSPEAGASPQREGPPSPAAAGSASAEAAARPPVIPIVRLATTRELFPVGTIGELQGSRRDRALQLRGGAGGGGAEWTATGAHRGVPPQDGRPDDGGSRARVRR